MGIVVRNNVGDGFVTELQANCVIKFKSLIREGIFSLLVLDNLMTSLGKSLAR